jgi:alkyl sulfatase BDS1-like metallo-beta-lactamase superfamily hydrolase
VGSRDAVRCRARPRPRRADRSCIIAIRIAGPTAWDEAHSIRWDITDTHEHDRMELTNRVLIHFLTSDEQL